MILKWLLVWREIVTSPCVSLLMTITDDNNWAEPKVRKREMVLQNKVLPYRYRQAQILLWCQVVSVSRLCHIFHSLTYGSESSWVVFKDKSLSCKHWGDNTNMLATNMLAIKNHEEIFANQLWNTNIFQWSQYLGLCEFGFRNSFPINCLRYEKKVRVWMGN